MMPEDIIQIGDIDLDTRPTLAKAVRDVIRRFYGQEFTARHVYAVILEENRFPKRDKLYDGVRAQVHTMKRRGKIETVTTGSIGNGNSSWFKEKKYVDTK